MFTPGSKGWINKYFDLVDRGEIELNIPEIEKEQIAHYLQIKFSNSGVMYGFPAEFIFCKHIDQSKWTVDEKLKILLFEALLLIYLIKIPHFKRHEFIESIQHFYVNHRPNFLQKFLASILNTKQEQVVETILTKRISLRGKFNETKFWLLYAHNVFVYIDILLYRDYITDYKEGTIYSYDDIALNALIVMNLVSAADGVIDEVEKNLYKLFLVSANLNDQYYEKAEKLFQYGAKIKDLKNIGSENQLYRNFLLNIAFFTLFISHDQIEKERKVIQKIAKKIGFDTDQILKIEMMVEQFLLKNAQDLPFVNARSNTDQMLRSVSKKWLKILGRNKDKMVIELKQSKDLIRLINKSRKEDLTKTEKELVKAQFKDLIKTVPSLAIFMLPGGAILLPILSKVLPDILPSAFKDNEIDN